MITRYAIGPRMSQAVKANGFVFTAGQVAADPSGDTAAQTAMILAQIDSLLAEASTDKTRIVSASIWLADIADFAAMNGEWDKWVPAGHTPARATVEARLATPAYRVEIAVIALA
jgi:enamine deaminase RidA (YjgF/YER057c/UK114 family)